MREHKYRLWDKEEKRFRYFDLRNLVGHCSGDVFDSETQEDVIHEPARGETTLISQEPLMQYTGLKDKNGVEIYEGDILSFSGIESHQLEVIYEIVTFAFVDIETDERMEFPRVAGRIIPNSFDSSRFEIIGNIHENSEQWEADNGQS